MFFHADRLIRERCFDRARDLIELARDLTVTLGASLPQEIQLTMQERTNESIAQADKLVGRLPRDVQEAHKEWALDFKL